LEEPLFDSETNSLVWLFSGLFDVSEISQSFLSSSFTLSAHAFFEPLEPSLPSLSAFDFLSLTFSLPQEEESEGREEEKTASETGKESSGDSQTVSGKDEEKSGKDEEKRETGEVARSERVSESKVQSAKETILKYPERARKVFEQEIAAKAISNAKKNPKSTAKGNGMVIIVGAYPEVLPADGKSTAFIVAKVTDEKGKPIAGKEISFSSNGGKILVSKAKTDIQGIAFSRICSEVLPKGQKKMVKVKAKVNPEAETDVLFDGSLSSNSTFSITSSASVSVYWWSNPPNTQSLVCSSNGGSASGFSGIAAHVVVPSSPPHFVYPNFLKVIGDGHPFQKQMGELYSDSYTPCAPYVGDGYVKYSWTVYPEMTGWQKYHRSNVSLIFNYTVARPYPPPGQFWTEEKVVGVQALNAILKLSPNNPPVFVWDPENPPPVEKRTVTFRVETLQNTQVAITVRIYRGHRYNDEGAIKEISVTVPTNQDVSVIWDGSVDSTEGVPPEEGGSMLAEKGVYAYDVIALVQQVVPNRFDADKRCSPSMKIERAKDENGREIFEAEYYGYDDNGTEEEEDDGHLYFIRWYVLKCGSAYFDNDGDAETSLFVDSDGDKRFDEDWVDGIDNDGDGMVDEDPGGGWDEDMPDGRDNDGDGLVDEDGPDPVNASQGQVLLYDPDLELVASWDLSSLLCLEHNANDGLVASLEGIRHALLVRVPVSLIRKLGEYRFVLQVWDNHAHLHKDHQVRPALELNQIVDTFPIKWIHGIYADTEWRGIRVNIPLLKQLVYPNKGIKTLEFTPHSNTGDHDKDLPSVQHYVWSQIIASARTGTLKMHTCRAAVNGTFFDHDQYPYELRGRVGIGSWPWSGKEIPKQRWAFGISSSLSFEKERMQRTGSNNYDVPSSWEGRYLFGLSGIGCLVDNGNKILDPNIACEGFTKMDGKYARTLIAWTKDQKHFFMIWSKGDYFNFAGLTDPYDPYWGEGWTWIEARDFLLDYLPYRLDYPVIVSENWRPQKRFDIYQGLLLDGGSHSDIIY
ncbi:MAG: hypothetical protein DFNUSKGM_003321, partial [Candidatus Fervidibacter sacchari]